MGFILNKPLEINLNDIHPKINQKFRIHFGGPVAKDTLFCLHNSKLKLKSSRKVTENLSYGCDIDEIITKSKSGVLNEDNIMFFLGYSGWTKNQLLDEISENYWKINKNYSKNIFERREENLWKWIMKKMGGDSYIWSNAPENLQDN